MNKGVSKYLEYAVKILTVKELGFDIDCVSLAENVVKTKNLPQDSLLGMFGSAGADAHNIIASNPDLLDKANTIAIQMYKDNNITF